MDGSSSSSLPNLNEVWVLKNASAAKGTPAWEKLNPTGTPPANRVDHSIVYDPTANRLIVHGGCVGNCAPSIGDTWVLTNANGLGGTPEWLQLPSSITRTHHGAGYDPVSNRMIVFGGHEGFLGTDHNDVTVLIDANGIGDPNWVTLTPTGTPPAPRFAHQSAYDPLSNSLIVFGGANVGGSLQYNDVWVLSNANGLGGTPTWAKLNPTGTVPAPRIRHGTAYDANSNRLIVFGGLDVKGGSPFPTFNDTWVLSNANGIGGTPEWKKLAIEGTLPLARASASTAYAGASNRLIVAMGRDDDLLPASELLNDVWILSPASGVCTANQVCKLNVIASDPDSGDTLTYSLDSAMPGMTINATTGQIQWTPTPAQIGDNPVTVRVRDAAGAFATRVITATVVPVAVPNVVGLDPDSAKALIGASDLNVGTITNVGGAVTLKFDSLPGQQGWTYEAFGQIVPEARVFSVSGGVLTQNSMGIGGLGAAQGSNLYEFVNVIDSRLPFSISERMRVLEEEGNFSARPFGHCFDEQTKRATSGVGFSKASIVDYENNRYPFDTTEFHTYRIEGVPGANFQVFFDDVPQSSSVILARYTGGNLKNRIILGDCTAAVNARVEITSYSFKQIKVNSQNPAADTLVHNKSNVDLAIQDGPATQTVPNVTGQTQAMAESAITAALLKVGVVTSENSAAPPGQIIAQKPVAGTNVPKDFAVDLVISLGPLGNHSPLITSTPIATAHTSEPYIYDVNATDIDPGDVLTFSLTKAPTGMTIDPVSGLIQWTPTFAQANFHDVIVTVSDQAGASHSQPFTVQVILTNHKPTITSSAVITTKEGVAYSYDVDATDIDIGDTLTYLLPGHPDGMSIDAVSGLITWTPTAAQVGSHILSVIARDSGGLDAVQTFTIVVKSANGPPNMTSSPSTLTEATKPYTYDADAIDPDGDVLIYSLSQAPTGMTINSTTGLVSWTPTITQIGPNPVKVTAADGKGASVTQTFSINVIPQQTTVPNIIGLSQAQGEAAIVAAQLVVGMIAKQNSDTVPAGQILNQSPAAGSTVDINSAVNLAVSLGPVNHPPVIISMPQQTTQTNKLYQYDVNVADLDPGDVHTFTLTQFPEGMTINATTGLIQWTPTLAQATIHRVAIIVTDKAGEPATQQYDLQVIAVPLQVNVPNVVSLDQAAAQTAIKTAKLAVGTVTNQSSDTVPVGKVISQSPIATTLVDEGSAVNLIISSGPPVTGFSSIVVLPADPTIVAGLLQPFTAFGLRANGTSENITASVTWSSGTPTVASINASGVATGKAQGTSVISATLGSLNNGSTLTVKAAAPGDTTPPEAAITAPTTDASITTLVDVIGTANDANFLKYTLDIAPVGETTFTTIATGTTAVINGKLATLDPTLLINDLYTLRLTVIDLANNTSQTSIQVQVAREQKVGNFTVAFQDLSIPVACLPITVTRVYDSRDKRKGDFGVGWRLDVNTMRLRTSSIQGQGWHIDLVDVPGPFGIPIPTYFLVQDEVHKVSLTLPDGHV
jgi:beta-lactam-binding protein with PASTA domain